MKITKEHLQVLNEEIALVLNKYPQLVAEYESGQFARAEAVKDLQKRFCFDLMYGAGLTRFVCDTLYKYMNDDHLYTALKAVCPKVTRNY